MLTFLLEIIIICLIKYKKKFYLIQTAKKRQHKSPVPLVWTSDSCWCSYHNGHSYYGMHCFQSMEKSANIMKDTFSFMSEYSAKEQVEYILSIILSSGVFLFFQQCDHQCSSSLCMTSQHQKVKVFTLRCDSQVHQHQMWLGSVDPNAFFQVPHTR